MLTYTPALSVTPGMHIRTNGGYWFTVGTVTEQNGRVYYREANGIMGGSYPSESIVPTLSD